MRKVSKHLKITGRVQGVGYRYFTRQNARDLNINGWVKNLPDGSVETVISGEQEDVEEMTNRLKKGPYSAKVSGLEELNQDGIEDEYHDFRVKR